MKRFIVFAIAVATAASVACGSNGEDGSPTSPSSTAGGTSGGSGSCGRPGAPTGLSADVIGSRVTLTWSASSGASEYLVLIGSTPSSSNVLFTNTTQLTYAWNGGSPGTYYARIQARNSCGNESGSSNEVAFTTVG
jgi:hypothetical protein